MLAHVVPLEANLIGSRKILGRFLIKWRLEHEVILIGGSLRDVSLFNIEGLVLIVLKVVVGEVIHTTEVEPAFHFIGFLLWLIIIKTLISDWAI